jgi:hypothetical protein
MFQATVLVRVHKHLDGAFAPGHKNPTMSHAIGKSDSTHIKLMACWMTQVGAKKSEIKNWR